MTIIKKLTPKLICFEMHFFLNFKGFTRFIPFATTDNHINPFTNIGAIA